jgi:hypothetical protein
VGHGLKALRLAALWHGQSGGKIWPIRRGWTWWYYGFALAKMSDVTNALPHTLVGTSRYEISRYSPHDSLLSEGRRINHLNYKNE